MHTYRWSPTDYACMIRTLLNTRPVHVGEWQGMDVSHSKVHMTYELEDVTFIVPHIPETIRGLQHLIQPDLPWAEDHFQERVSGWPHNPPPSHTRWPHAVRGNADHVQCKTCGSKNPETRMAYGPTVRLCPDEFHQGNSGLFDHTYPERFWPKHAGHDAGNCKQSPDLPCLYGERPGIRFPYGDLDDLVQLLVRSPMTRQAYLPVWFPEDTGAVSGQRVPCTLGYHFMIRDSRLSCRYYIRSCDVRRHLTNDVYFACRLTQWVTEQFNTLANTFSSPGQALWTGPILPGRMLMHISSLHGFVGDKQKLLGLVDETIQTPSHGVHKKGQYPITCAACLLEVENREG